MYTLLGKLITVVNILSFNMFNLGKLEYFREREVVWLLFGFATRVGGTFLELNKDVIPILEMEM